MMTIKTILCPVDFSDCSNAALGFAIELARLLGARLRLLHVFQLPYLGWDEGMTMTAASAELMQVLQQRADHELKKQLERCRSAGVETVAEQVDGVPHHKIAEQSEQADLLVMGTHGRSGLPRLMLGSVAERVVRSAKCPVLTVPAPEKSA
jgi:nucleotide-binding universal stress UspA family protein